MRYLFILAVAGLGMVSMSEANGQNFKAATPPPKVAKRAAVEFEGCTVNIAEVRAKYPTLSGFLQETAFQGGNLVFPNAKEAIAHYARTKGLDPKVLRKQLKAESQDVKKNYLKSKACKTATWWALGAQVGAESFVDSTVSGIEAEPLD